METTPLESWNEFRPGSVVTPKTSAPAYWTEGVIEKIYVVFNVPMATIVDLKRFGKPLPLRPFELKKMSDLELIVGNEI